MARPMRPHPDPQFVADTVLAHLSARDGRAWSLTGPTRLMQRAWSTLYFLSAADGQGQPNPLVVKIVQFPNQQRIETSWESDELLLRGRREFESISRVYQHFAAATDRWIAAPRPQAYLPSLNAVVVDFVVGLPLYPPYVSSRRLLFSQRARREARTLMHRAGAWLRWFHRLSLSDMPLDRVFGPRHALDTLRQTAEWLRSAGVSVESWPRWQGTLDALRRVTVPLLVWTHGDFHQSNVLVSPEGRVFCLDTALERIDSPYYDLGKFVATLRTPRTRILSMGLLPPRRVVDGLVRAFLQGYFAGDPTDTLPLALYEGYFIFQKWQESIEAAHDALHGRSPLLCQIVCRGVINPTFRGIVRHWMDSVAAADEERRRRVKESRDGRR
ncbi:MAG: hypothetical protein Kow00124_24580 [Anaerolineae bacterium]